MATGFMTYSTGNVVVTNATSQKAKGIADKNQKFVAKDLLLDVIQKIEDASNQGKYFVDIESVPTQHAKRIKEFITSKRFVGASYSTKGTDTYRIYWGPNLEMKKAFELTVRNESDFSKIINQRNSKALSDYQLMGLTPSRFKSYMNGLKLRDLNGKLLNLSWKTL